MKKSELLSIIKEEIKVVITENDEKYKKQLELILKKKVKTSVALDWLTDYKGLYNNRNMEDWLEELGHDEETIGYGAGELELSLEKLGYKLSPSDIAKMDPTDVSSLIYNIFYNGRGLKKFAGSNVIAAMVKYIEKKGHNWGSQSGLEIDNEITGLSNARTRGKEAQALLNAFAKFSDET